MTLSIKSFIPTFLYSIFFNVLIMISLYGASAPAFDFDQFLSELESALAQIEDDEKNQPTETSSASNTTTNTSSPEQKESRDVKTKEQDMQDTYKTPTELFINPTIQSVGDDSSKQQKSLPSKASKNAYSRVMNDLITYVTSIEQKIKTVKRFSPEFREEFANSYHHLIATINIAHQHIESKSAYKNLFLAPPVQNKQLVTDMQKLRTLITEFIKKIKRIDEKISVTEEEEKDDDTEDLLRNLAKEKPVQQQNISPTDADSRDTIQNPSTTTTAVENKNSDSFQDQQQLLPNENHLDILSEIE